MRAIKDDDILGQVRLVSKTGILKPFQHAWETHAERQKVSVIHLYESRAYRSTPPFVASSSAVESVDEIVLCLTVVEPLSTRFYISMIHSDRSPIANEFSLLRY
jgi:hypothetical protein